MDDQDRVELAQLVKELRADLALLQNVPLPGMVKRAVTNSGRILEILVKREVNRNV